MAQHSLRATPETVRIGAFDARFPAVMTVASGDTVQVQCVSGREEVLPPPGSGLAVPPELTAIIAANPGMVPGHICSGPIAIAGAMPGDMLEVRIEAIEPGADWGYNMIRPLAGTLPEDFHETSLMIIPIDRAARTCRLPWGLDLPLAPFFGVMGWRRRRPSGGSAPRSRGSMAATSTTRS
ncbi:acetamidase/formamidase family protein [Paeniroseomonas aquatica]|uniref:acetamidase/formamidase family protein n=1 Tax=Paeniroseomonas aquatica TaxID=373043 RepID=UPI0036104A80